MRYLTKLIVVLSEFTVADGSVLVDNASDLNSAFHAGRVPTELDHFDFTPYTV